MPKQTFITDDEDEEIVEKKSVTKETKHVFDATDGIECRSVVQGGLYMEGAKTKMEYSWGDYGDISEVEYRDLVAAVRLKSKFVFNPWFIIENEDFLKEFPQVKKFYDSSYTIKDLIKILDMPVNDMIAEIKKLPKGAVDSIKSLAANQVSTGTLDSVKKIRALDEYFGTDLNLLASLIDE